MRTATKVRRRTSDLAGRKMSNGCRFNDAETMFCRLSEQQRAAKRHLHRRCQGCVPAFALLQLFNVHVSKSTDTVRAPGVGEQIR